MTDRELLEAAAKTAGIELEWPQHVGGADYLSPRETADWQLWNPLKNDGDALRLACKLHINVFIYEDETSTATGGVSAKNWGSVEANTRRAIVRTAAAMAVG